MTYMSALLQQLSQLKKVLKVDDKIRSFWDNNQFVGEKVDSAGKIDERVQKNTEDAMQRLDTQEKILRTD